LIALPNIANFFVSCHSKRVYRKSTLMVIQKKKFNKIKMILLEKEKTSLWLANKLGVSQTAVSKWCTNRNQPTVETLFEIAEVLEVDVCDLLVRKFRI